MRVVQVVVNRGDSDKMLPYVREALQAELRSVGAHPLGLEPGRLQRPLCGGFGRIFCWVYLVEKKC
jgi:hypothetical protein